MEKKYMEREGKLFISLSLHILFSPFFPMGKNGEKLEKTHFPMGKNGVRPPHILHQCITVYIMGAMYPCILYPEKCTFYTNVLCIVNSTLIILGTLRMYCTLYNVHCTMYMIYNSFVPSCPKYHLYEYQL